jgi:hypothetical protein
MARKRLSQQKQRHEIAKYLSWLDTVLYEFARRVGATVGPLTRAVTDEAVGYFSLPSRQIFEKLTGFTPPIGMIFPDSSFLVFKETIRFGYRSDAEPEPAIYRTEYSFQYQRPADRFYFRFDHHPLKGDPATHPRYHLHSATWSLETGKLQAVPRYDDFEIDLPHVLRLIERDFFTSPS